MRRIACSVARRFWSHAWHNTRAPPRSDPSGTSPQCAEQLAQYTGRSGVTLGAADRHGYEQPEAGPPRTHRKPESDIHADPLSCDPLLEHLARLAGEHLECV